MTRNSIIFANNIAGAVKIFTNKTVKDPKILPYMIPIIVPIIDNNKPTIIPGKLPINVGKHKLLIFEFFNSNNISECFWSSFNDFNYLILHLYL